MTAPELAGRLRCYMGLHRWEWNRYVRDWFCDRCRRRRRSMGIRL